MERLKNAEIEMTIMLGAGTLAEADPVDIGKSRKEYI
jgi:hypothetical protein